MPTQHFRRRSGGPWDDELLGASFNVVRHEDVRLHVEVIDSDELAEEHPMERELYVLHHSNGERTFVHAQSFVNELLEILGRHRSEKSVTRAQMRRDVERAGGHVDGEPEPAVEVGQKGGVYSVTREPKRSRRHRFLVWMGLRPEED